MKRSVILLMCAICIFVSGCSGGGETSDADVPKQIDIDLSEMSNVLAYSQISSILDSPDDYLDKTIRINGQYLASFYEETDSYYHFVVVADSSLCCQYYLEFELSGESAYPNDYPEENANIEVVGVFARYDELGETFYHLLVDEISVL